MPSETASDEHSGKEPVAELVEDVTSSLAFPVIGVGASAGGIDALNRFLEALPPDPGAAIVLVLHLDPSHESMLSSILGRATAMPVREAADGMAVECDHVYVIPPNATVALADGHLQVRPRTEANVPPMPVDHLFRSLAESQKNMAMGVILSGGGTDGTLGLQEINAAEGITFAQNLESAAHDSMPRSAIASGCVDFVLPPESIAKEIVRIVQDPSRPRQAESLERQADDPKALLQVFALLRRNVGVDFAQYKQSTVHRRIRRRMALHEIRNFSDYLRYLEDNPAEVRALYQDLLIRVTSFFRDPAAFNALGERALPRLFDKRDPAVPVRIWVAGCSTGEEVYSIAIKILEYLEDKAADWKIKILASDINEAALQKARGGAYVENIETDVSPERLRRFFTKGNGYYQINKSIRDLCVFSRHNVVRDPPFSRIDLLTCRNLLIYLALSLQKRVVPLFHYALNPGGMLMLGTSETIGTFSDLFEVLDEKQKIYLKRERTHTALGLYLASPDGDYQALQVQEASGEKALSLTEVQREADRIVLQQFGPAGVVVDQNGNIVQFRGHTGPYLENAPGNPTLNVLRMAREGLLIELRALHLEAKAKNAPVRKEKIRIREGDNYRIVNLHILPIRRAMNNKEEPFFLVLFEEAGAETPPAGGNGSAPKAAPELAEIEQDYSATIDRLQQELDATREFLQASIEEHESTTEELKSANEEILSSNEEMQSTNEELQSAKEELQSANEELITVNEEVHHRNQELAKLNDDLVNLFAGVNIPIVIVDRDLSIRRLTPMAEKLFNLIPTDVGRSIAALRPNLDLPRFDQMIAEVIRNLQGKETETKDREGRSYLVRILPYVTQENKIDGASIVAIDVDPLRRNLEQANLLEMERVARHDAESSSRAKDEFLAMLAHELRNPLAPLSNALYLLGRPSLDQKDFERMLGIAQRQMKHLTRMLDDLLDVARVSRGKIRLQKAPLDVQNLVVRAVEAVQSVVDEAGHKLNIVLPQEPMWLEADATRLEQVLVNLLYNAIKYTPRGGRIDLTVQPLDDVVELRVRDNGMGISSEMLPRVFDAFAQADRSLDRASGGLGIGLTLVKRLVELHGGAVDALSHGEGKGSEFVVRLPAHSGAAPSKPEPEGLTAPKQAARDVLIVDDSRDNAESLAVYLRSVGHKVRVASTGEGALEACKTVPPDVVLLDIGLPGMDGFTVARALRQVTDMDKLLIVALTGYGSDEDQKQAREAGFDYFLVKPVELEQLREVLSRQRVKA